ncbi:MAG: lipopolysaccharide kinase InaA family protein [Kiritimatiellia bacterium]|jgi:hypothetical protein
MPPSLDWSAVGPYRCWVNPPFASPALEADLAQLSVRLASPAVRVLQEGRHRTVRLPLGPADAPLDAVVKAFGRQSPLMDRFARAGRGTKAMRTCMAAVHLAEHGIDTPPPIACLERWEGSRLVESYFLSRHVDGMTDFRDELIRLFRTRAECACFMELLDRVAQAVRRLHDAGFQHRDLGNQNILLGPGATMAERRVYFIDLNRGVCHARPLTPRERARDLSRIALPTDLLRVFFAMVWGETPPPRAFARAERFHRRAFAFHSATRLVRRPLRTLRQRAAAREAKAAGETPSGGWEAMPPPRDLWIWDSRTEQPVQAWRSPERRKWIDPRLPFQLAAATAAAHGATSRAARALRAAAFAAPVGFDGRIAVALSGRAATFERERSLLRELGARDTLVRFNPQDAPALLRDALDIAAALSREGFRVAGALLQDRASVNDPSRWREFCRRVVDSAAPHLSWLEFGHAINRVKWGLWSLREYETLLAPLPELRAAHPGLRIVGPAVIDWDPPFLQAALRRLPDGFSWDALSMHLYVDRRGAPENLQGRQDALGKFILARAAARASGGRCADRFIVSEVNWPLLGTGVYSPVGSPYVTPGPRFNDPSVSERDYADYLIRYLLIALASGMVEQTVVWRLAAHGFGLVDAPPGGDFRRRPAFEALKRLFAELAGGTFVRRRPVPPGADPRTAYELEFVRADGTPLRIGWDRSPPEIRGVGPLVPPAQGR